MIILENVSKTFHAGNHSVEAVNNVSLSIRQGEIYGIIGFSGAGKSTLVRCINLLERPTSGKVFLDDLELTTLSERDLRKARKQIGMIFQQFNLLASRTAAQNIAYPLRYSGLSKNDIRKRVHELLALVDLEDKENAYPSQLSGGQKQRVAIARALANNPKILLCDEATSALDPQTTRSILKLLKKLNAQLGFTVVVITHEMQVVKEICDRVAVMEKGEIIEEGEVFSVFASPTKKVTKDFINTTTNLSKIDELLEEKSPVTALRRGECILKLKYLEKNASEALVSHISREFQIDVNIIFGNIEIIGEAPLGGLVAIVSGDARKIDKAIEFLKDKNVGVEVVADARVS
ncbi:MAG: ATP-binding cassette domain-containing protein [Clostridiaceae bacterium]|nr:ATP-binding cassette domain-containing protein [Clostridiaceae bacterium]